MYKSSDFWRESQVALKSELYHKYWQLGTFEKAWLIAALEVESDLKIVIDEFGHDDDGD